jgi:hypothetical protein
MNWDDPEGRDVAELCRALSLYGAVLSDAVIACGCKTGGYGMVLPLDYADTLCDALAHAVGLISRHPTMEATHVPFTPQGAAWPLAPVPLVLATALVRLEEDGPSRN